jgi:diguanylate cyclase (GGDEF)-like protein
MPESELDVSLLDALQVGVILLDCEGRVLAWNRWFQAHLGLELGDCQGRTLGELFPETAQARLGQALEQALRFRLASVLTPGLNKPVLPLFQKPADRQVDRRMQQLIHVTPLRQGQVACLVQIQDMTATVRRERRLRVQSTQLLDATYRDSLTGVGNRRRFDHAIEELLAKSRKAGAPLALLMVDVDKFKAYNDLYGHPRGDEALRLVAMALQHGLRQDAGDLICRYGGEEFAIFLPGADEASACLVAERLRIRVEATKLIHEGSQVSPYVTISLGLTVMKPEAPQPSHILVTGADLALYHAKEEGRNRCMAYDMATLETRACA